LRGPAFYFIVSRENPELFGFLKIHLLADDLVQDLQPQRRFFLSAGFLRRAGNLAVVGAVRFRARDFIRIDFGQYVLIGLTVATAGEREQSQRYERDVTPRF